MIWIFRLLKTSGSSLANIVNSKQKRKISQLNIFVCTHEVLWSHYAHGKYPCSAKKGFALWEFAHRELQPQAMLLTDCNLRKHHGLPFWLARSNPTLQFSSWGRKSHPLEPNWCDSDSVKHSPTTCRSSRRIDLEIQHLHRFWSENPSRVSAPNFTKI